MTLKTSGEEIPVEPTKPFNQNNQSGVKVFRETRSAHYFETHTGLQKALPVEGVYAASNLSGKPKLGDDREMIRQL